MIEVYKNDLISASSFTDLAGNTVYKAGYGTRRLYLDFISGSYEADENELLSTMLVCDLCGKPAKKKGELQEVNGFQRCKDCIDEE